MGIFAFACVRCPRHSSSCLNNEHFSGFIFRFPFFKRRNTSTIILSWYEKSCGDITNYRLPGPVLAWWYNRPTKVLQMRSDNTFKSLVIAANFFSEEESQSVTDSVARYLVDQRHLATINDNIRYYVLQHTNRLGRSPSLESDHMVNRR